uniref:Uncharacterized protein n=1 Tax=Phlebotomus papatasi TaxID=29031 RepID=A0A1B0D5H0_PHLPP
MDNNLRTDNCGGSKSCASPTLKSPWSTPSTKYNSLPPRQTNHFNVDISFDGIIVTCLALAAGPYSGGCMNPARVIGPALYNGDWENHWVYWVGPLLASIVSPYLYKSLFVNAKFPVAPEYKSAVQTPNVENQSQAEDV